MTTIQNYISTTIILISIAATLWLIGSSSIAFAFDQHTTALTVPKESLSNYIFDLLEENELINYFRTNGLVANDVTDGDLKEIFLLAEQASDMSENLDKALVLAIIATESNFDMNAQNAGTLGLMQLNPKYQWKRIEKILGHEGVYSDLYDPYTNIFVGADYLDAIINEVKTYKNIPENYKEAFSLMWYNMGPSVASDVYFNNDISQYARIVLNRRDLIDDILTKGDVYRASAKDN